MMATMGKTRAAAKRTEVSVDMALVSPDERREICRTRGAEDAARPACRRCHVINEHSNVVSTHDDVVSGMVGLRMSTTYSFLVTEDGIVLARRMPVLNASIGKMTRVEAAYVRKRKAERAASATLDSGRVGR